jgi:plasmid stabilization system protein ParE
MSLPVRLLARARVEFDEASDEYDRRSPGLGRRFTMAVDRVLERIGDTPELYAVLFGDVRRAPVRKFPFVVLYRATAAEVVVLAVLPAKSDPAGWPDRA